MGILTKDQAEHISNNSNLETVDIPLNLYLVGRTDEVDYDETVSVVVRASCESDARRLVTRHASGDEAIDNTWSEGFRGYHFWYSEASFVTLLASGVEGDEGIVCRNFNAG